MHLVVASCPKMLLQNVKFRLTYQLKSSYIYSNVVAYVNLVFMNEARIIGVLLEQWLLVFLV